MAVTHEPKLTIRKATNGKYRFRVSRYAPDREGGKPDQQNQATSQLYADKDNAQRGFIDLAEAVILILHKEGKLWSTLEKLGLSTPIPHS